MKEIFDTVWVGVDIFFEKAHMNLDILTNWEWLEKTAYFCDMVLYNLENLYNYIKRQIVLDDKLFCCGFEYVF